MSLTGTFAWIRPTGPWLAVYEITDPTILPGPVCARATLDRDSGLVLNVATVPTGSWVLGWYPRHRGCIASPTRTHTCLWSWLPEVRVETHPLRPEPQRTPSARA